MRKTALDSLVNELLRATRRITGEGEHSLHEPLFGASEQDLVQETISSTMVSSAGERIAEFENLITDFTESSFAVATINGTAALQVALEVSGLRPGDEVLIPSLTFAATASAVVNAGGVPVLIDSDPERIGLDPNSLRSWLELNTAPSKDVRVNKNSGATIHSLVPVHLFGHPVELDTLLEICEEFNILVIEDAAESLGSFYKGKHTGTFGKAGMLSFNGNKTITTGGGGMILTDSEELATKARHLVNTAKVPHAWEYIHDEVGYNFRLPNLNAALGVAQMKGLADILELQRKLYELYFQELNSLDGIALLEEPSDSRSNYWLQTILLDKNRSHLRDEILNALTSEGLKVRPAWRPLHLLSPYSGFQRTAMDGTEDIYSRLINLPSSPKFAVGI
jgi:aminotransferase in exopolysaccharide biosynthesis